MFLLWLVTLLIYGAFSGFAEIHALHWLLLITFAAQDHWDTSNKKPRR